jgi:hypothetical protein
MTIRMWVASINGLPACADQTRDQSAMTLGTGLLPIDRAVAHNHLRHIPHRPAQKGSPCPTQSSMAFIT